METVAVVVVAAGRGTRAGDTVPKQYRELWGEPVLARTLRRFASHAGVHFVQPVIHADDRGRYGRAIQSFRDLSPILEAVLGGRTRQESVFAGLSALAPRNPSIVLVHDAARPFVTGDLITRAIAAAAAVDAAVPVVPVADSVMSVRADGRIERHLDRDTLRAVQTPQAFRFRTLLDAHRRAAEAQRFDFPDDGSLATFAGARVATFAGETRNVKLTTNEDFMRAEAEGEVRIGSGYDVHAFGPGSGVVLGGVRIPHGCALQGHSDADVVLHAATDAVLGALADGDIGVHFPPSDPQWRGASSDRFLAFACARARQRGGSIAHLDVTLVCEAPRIGPHRDAMRARIAEIAGIAPDRVGVKATTNEGLGFLGRGEGIAALATATLRLPRSADHE